MLHWREGMCIEGRPVGKHGDLGKALVNRKKPIGFSWAVCRAFLVNFGRVST